MQACLLGGQDACAARRHTCDLWVQLSGGRIQQVQPMHNPEHQPCPTALGCAAWKGDCALARKRRRNAASPRIERGHAHSKPLETRFQVLHVVLPQQFHRTISREQHATQFLGRATGVVQHAVCQTTATARTRGKEAGEPKNDAHVLSQSFWSFDVFVSCPSSSNWNRTDVRSGSSGPRLLSSPAAMLPEAIVRPDNNAKAACFTPNPDNVSQWMLGSVLATRLQDFAASCTSLHSLPTVKPAPAAGEPQETPGQTRRRTLPACLQNASSSSMASSRAFESTAGSSWIGGELAAFHAETRTAEQGVHHRAAGIQVLSVVCCQAASALLELPS